MLLVTVTIKDTESNYSYGHVFGLIPGHNVKRVPLERPMVDSDGLVLYTLDVTTFVSEGHKFPGPALTAEEPK